jgi:peptidoglycan LD-endopeptidase LytH
MFVMRALCCGLPVRRVLALPLVAALALLLGMPNADADDRGITEARHRANTAAQELAAAETALGRLDQEINDLQARAEAAQARLDRLRGVVRDTVVQQFINADAAQVQVPDVDVNRQARADALTRFVTQGNQDAIDEFLAVAEDLEVTTSELAERKAAQEGAVTELRAKRAALDAELRRLEEIERRRLEEERRKQEEERRRRAAEEARRQAVLEAARQSTTSTAAPQRSSDTSGPSTTRSPATTAPAPSAAPAPSSSPSGSFVCPVQGPHAFVDSWGAPRSGGRRHQGVDMMAARGVPTVAPVSGRVEHRGNSLGGLSWHVYGDDGNYYYGTHLSAYANQGAGRVAAGTVIGYVGDTGNAAGNPHLHFEIHRGGRGNPINPYPTVRAHC